MSTRLSRSLRAFISYLLVFLITYSFCGLVIELIWLPIVAWMHNYDGYLWPSKSRIYAWCKLVPFATIVSGVGVWIYDRKRIGW
ncbi:MULTISPECIES: hypothetical protein [Pandoraea]|uniref:Uncharacterized protein n=1 Tax=Pandoraea morbifera TaxID=2508300 RepID=A0A5E4VXK8_9BURK|nr:MULTISPECIES: hypothetical protein [Pandoraea]VVE16286.1 hypothetical protein PMO31116_02870 [Pandoraea morbifera]